MQQVVVVQDLLGDPAVVVRDLIQVVVYDSRQVSAVRYERSCGMFWYPEQGCFSVMFCHF